jgi:hypothetical protein
MHIANMSVPYPLSLYLKSFATSGTLVPTDDHLVHIANMSGQGLPVGKTDRTVGTGEAHAPMRRLGVQFERPFSGVAFDARATLEKWLGIQGLRLFSRAFMFLNSCLAVEQLATLFAAQLPRINSMLGSNVSFKLLFRIKCLIALITF